MGRWLLMELERSAAQHLPSPAPAPYGLFVLCVPGATPGRYLVLTTRNVMYLHAREPMWVPALRWSSSIRDLELASLQGASLSLVAERPLRRHILRAGAPSDPGLAPGARQGGRGAPGRPFAFLEVECESAAAAVQVHGTLRQLMDSLPPWRLFCGQTEILLLDAA